jgi:hypothetical protein
MVEAFFGFKRTPFGDSPDAKQLFASQARILPALDDAHGSLGLGGR